MFVIVWILVILQFSTSKETELTSLKYVKISERVFKVEAETAVSSESVSEEEREKGNLLNRKSSDHTSQKEVINIEDYDFSDISIPDGIPIEAILIKLKLR
jgi:hypothetical protein